MCMCIGVNFFHQISARQKKIDVIAWPYRDERPAHLFRSSAHKPNHNIQLSSIYSKQRQFFENGVIFQEK